MRLIILLVCSFSFLQTNAQVDQDKISTTQKFDEVLTYVKQKYVDEIDAEKLTDAAIVALLEELDPHSVFIPKEDVEEANRDINGSFVGIGIRFQILRDTLMVVATIPGGPSEKLGIKAGDKIIRIENEVVAGIGLKNQDVRGKLMGDKGTTVRVQIERQKSKNLDFVITRDKIPINSVDASYMVTDKTGYIKLNSFSRTSLSEVEKALRDLKSKGMENLIFDLQGNGGGLLYTAKGLADHFLSGDKMIVYSEGRTEPKRELKSEFAGMWEEGRLVILTDEGSASASEILSGAVQDWDRGLIVGRRTFGKGLVQHPIELTDGSQIRLTTARYYTPSGRFIQKSYEDKEAYKHDLLNRYENGEMVSQDSISFPDSLKFETRLSKRTVYGGGGIMPDYFVPLDTTENSDLLSDIVRGGYVNTFCLNYVNDNRDELHETYLTFDDFYKSFQITDEMVTDLIEFSKEEDSELELDLEDLKVSDDLLKTRMKASIANDMWGTEAFYQIINTKNEILQAAVEIIESDTYDKAGLTSNTDSN